MWIFEFIEREVVSLQRKNMLNFRFLSLSVSHHIIFGGGGGAVSFVTSLGGVLSGCNHILTSN